MAGGLYVSRDLRHSSRWAAKALVSALAFFWAAWGTWQPRRPGLPLRTAFSAARPNRKKKVPVETRYPPVDTPEPIVMREMKAPLAYQIRYAEPASVDKAVQELDGLDYAGEPLFVTAGIERRVVNAQGSFYGSTREDVLEYFEQVGKVEDAESYVDWRYGEVRFKSAEDAWEAKVELDGTELMGKRLRVELDCTSWRMNTVLVHGLSREVQWQEIKDHFKQAGEVTWTTVHGGRTAKIIFATEIAAEVAIRRLNKSRMGGGKKSLQVVYPWDKTRGTLVHVRALPSDVTADDLVKHFQPCGLIESVNIEDDLMPPEFCQ